MARSCMLALLACLAAGCATTGPEVCSGYLSSVNCTGGPRAIHHGMDFRSPAGTEVISATRGTVVAKRFTECPGHVITIKTDIVAHQGDAEGPVYAVYAHTEPLPELKIGQRISPGDPIGRIIPLRHTKCYGSAEHVHFELRVNNDVKRHIDPHQFWVDGPGKVTCFKDAASVPAGKAVAPLRCSANAISGE